jgi:hypothetical protein
MGLLLVLGCRGDVVDLGGELKLGEDGTEAGLQAALLRGGKLRGDAEVGQAHEGLLDILQAFLALVEGGRGDGAWMGLGPKDTERRVQERAAVGGVGHAVGADEREGLTLCQLMGLETTEHGILVVVRESAQGVGDGGTEAAGSQCALRRGGQPFGDQEATCDPFGFPVQKPCDSVGRQTVLVQEGGDHAGLVECGEGARRRVGGQKQPLLLRD